MKSLATAAPTLFATAAFRQIALLLLIGSPWLFPTCERPFGESDSFSPVEWTGAPVGKYRAVLASPGGELVFGLEFRKAQANASDGGVAADSLQAFLVNGGEQIEIPSLRWDPETRSIVLSLPHYESTVEATVDSAGVTLQGEWQKRIAGANRWRRMEFAAERIESWASLYRKCDGGGLVLEPRWRVAFESQLDPAVAKFEIVDDQLRGTFLTTTGDYRYLAGGISGNQLELSCFDGAHAFLFRAALQPDGSLDGQFWSGDSWREAWQATPDAEVKLPDAFQEVQWRDQVELADLSFPDLNGVQRRLNEPAFQGKAVLLQLFGSWCPNCHDAAEFLVELDREFNGADPRRGSGRKDSELDLPNLSIVGLAFELTGDFASDVEAVKRYQMRHQSTYPMLVVGVSDKEIARDQFGGLERIKAFPTAVFFDRHGRCRAVYSGFSGPATGEDYDELKRRFREIIRALQRE